MRTIIPGFKEVVQGNRSKTSLLLIERGIILRMIEDFSLFNGRLREKKRQAFDSTPNNEYS